MCQGSLGRSFSDWLQIRPETLGQAARIPGMTPAAVAVLGVFLNRLSPAAPPDVSSREFQDRLARRARRAGLTIRQDLGAQLEIYYRLLSTWNKKINLTGLNLSDFGARVARPASYRTAGCGSHVRPAVRSLLDIGSGGGSPAIPLALALPTSAL